MDNYNVSDGSEFQLDPTSDCGAALACFKNHFVLCCGHSSAFNFDRTFLILGSNKDSHNILDEFEFQPDPTIICRVICPSLCEKSIFSVVATLAPSFFFGPSLFLEVTRTSVTSRMSLNFDQIRPFTAELSTLYCVKNQYLVLWPL